MKFIVLKCKLRLLHTAGASSVKTSVVKDGNVFMIHVCDPAAEETITNSEVSSEVEKSETEQQEKDKPNKGK